MVECRSESGIVTKRLSGCYLDVGLSEGVMDAEESGKYVEKAGRQIDDDEPSQPRSPATGCLVSVFHQ